MRVPFALLLVMTGAAQAGARQEMVAAITRCNSLSDERQFLDCVYGAAQPVRAELGLPAASLAQQRLVPPASTLAETQAAAVATSTARPPSHSGFSLFGDSLHMTGYSFDKRGLFEVNLSDGSVWRQIARDTNFAHFAGKASDYQVSINVSDTGISRMSVHGEGGPYQVERLR